MNLTKKKVLITGGTGFIGRAVIFALAGRDWEITQGIRSVAKSVLPNFVYLDLADPSSVLALANGIQFDAIVHLGAKIDLENEAKSELYAENALSTGCLAFLASQWHAHLIYASSVIVCGARTGFIDNCTKVLTDTGYGYSKWLGEQMIAGSGALHCILRIAGVYGPGGPIHLGLNRAIDGAIHGLIPTQIGSGLAMRNYVYVKDVAEAIVFALDRQLEGIHLLAGSEILSISQMMTEICSRFLPGHCPLHKDGPEAMTQLIEPSSSLPKTRNFKDGLADIKAFLP